MAGSKKGDELLARYQSKDQPLEDKKDKVLLLPYDRANQHALEAYQKHKINAFAEELSKIRKHVDIAVALYAKACAGYHLKKSQDSPSKPSGKKVKSDQDDMMLACARAYAQPLSEELFLTRDVDQVKASYAYTVVRTESFAFSVAFQEICHIMAVAASGGHAPTLRIFDEAKSFSSSFLRALNRCTEDPKA